MVGPHDLVRNEEPQPQPLVAAGLTLSTPERVEQMRHEVFRDAGTVVAHGELERQADAGTRSRHAEPHAGPEGRGHEI